MGRKYQKFPKWAEENRTFILKLISQNLKSTLLTTSDVIFYFYFQQRLFHPNEVERIELQSDHTIKLIFQLQELALMFFLKCVYAKNQHNNTQFELQLIPIKFAQGDKFVYRNAFAMNACVLQRPIHQDLDPTHTRTKSRCISRWNGLVSMNMYHPKFVSFFVYDQPYSDPRNKKHALYQLPPPIVERFELSRENVENYILEENAECLVIDFSLCELPTFYQYGFIATEIKSDAERLRKKYASYDEEKKCDSVDSKSVAPDSDDDFVMNWRHEQRITAGAGGEYFDEDLVDADYIESVHKMQKKHNRNYMKSNDEDIITDIHKSREICPHVRIKGYCEKYRRQQCPYKYHPQMEKNVDFGNDTQLWTNPNNRKIVGMAAARRQPTDINEEFVSYIVPGDKHIPCLYLQDIMQNCFILRVTLIKSEDFIRRDFYAQRLTDRFGKSVYDRFSINRYLPTPKHYLSDNKYTQHLPYPLLRHSSDNTNKFYPFVTSPLCYTESIDLDNASYRESMKAFIKQLNANHGESHLEAFCLMACLINYPPIFIIEDFHVTDFNLLEQDIRDGDRNKVWQVLKKLSEGNIDYHNSKWKSLESSGKGGSGRGKKGELDKNLPRHAASCRERYCCRGGRNTCFMDIYIDMYFNVDFLNQLKQQELGRSKNRFEWVKTIKITPMYYHLVVDQEKSCRMFRLKAHLRRSAVTFLRVEFQSSYRSARWSDEWEYGSCSRQQVYNMLTYGFSCAGALYEFFFFSDGQLRDKVCWMYSCQLSRKFNSIKAVRNNMGNFEKIRNPGKKMSRMGLYNTKSTQIATVKYSQVEFVDDPVAKDGIELTDGCSIINKQIVNEKVDKNVVSMLARLGGAKCMLVALPNEWIRKVIKTDQKNKREILLKKINEEKCKGADESKLKLLKQTLQDNENRNFNADVVITRTSNKFTFDKYCLEIAVKEQTESSGAFINKEFIGAAYCHFYLKKEAKQFEKTLQKYALEWFGILNGGRRQKKGNRFLPIHRTSAEIFLDCDKHKGIFKFLLMDMGIVKNRIIKNQGLDRRRFWQKRYQNRNLKVLCDINNEADRCNSIAKTCWVKTVQKLHIHLPWPSCRMEGVADWTGTLSENEIFLKIEVPPTVRLWCKKCNTGLLEATQSRCSNRRCEGVRPQYLVYEGKCGLLKNPCLHPRGYKLFTAVNSELLNNLCDGECLLFSTQTSCTTSPVFAMSGADLDGDDFLVVTQKDLLPNSDYDMEYKYGIKVQKFDEQGQLSLPEYIDDYTIVDYFLEYALHENTAELSQLHEAYSEHNVEGIGHRDCLEIAKYHSFALDFPKTGKAAIFPKDNGIPMNNDINKYGHCIYPHYMSKKPEKMKFHSTMIKGRMYDFILDKLPHDLARDRKFRKEAGLIDYPPNLPPRPFLREAPEENNKFGYNQQNHNGKYQAHRNQINQNQPVQNQPVQNQPVHNQHVQNHVQPQQPQPPQPQQFDYKPQPREEYRNKIPANCVAGISGIDNANHIHSQSKSQNERARHENIDNDDYHWQDGAMYNGDINDEYGDENNEWENDQMEDNMKWIEEITYDELVKNIKTPQVKSLLENGEFCTWDDIKKLRFKLDEYRRQITDEFKQYEALHVDYYYETIIQGFKNQQMHQRQAEDSDNIYENEELKQSYI